jgi:UrcA family protein
MTKTAVVILGAFLTAMASRAIASPLEARTEIVSFADLDLSSAAGRDRLERRVASAARRVCGWASPVDLKGLTRMRTCRSESFAEAMASRRIGEAEVTEIALR